MNRRDLIRTAAAGALAWPLAAKAGPKRVGVLMSTAATDRRERQSIVIFLQALASLGWVDGRNIEFSYGWGAGDAQRMEEKVRAMVMLNPDVLLVKGGALPATLEATSTIPIVFVDVGDPVGIGLVASLARPGGNVTGFTNISTELMPKLVELLTELAPQTKVIALLVNSNNANAEGIIRNTQEAARAKRVELHVLKGGTEAEIDMAFTSLDQLQAGGLVIDPDGFLTSRREQIVALASRHAVPTVYANRQAVAAGGLISYGIDEGAVRRQAGIYAGRILKGAKPADLPVQQPTTFKLAVNLRTARALGLTVPQLLLAIADEVIE